MLLNTYVVNRIQMCYNLRRNPLSHIRQHSIFLEKCHFCLNSEREMVMGTCPPCGEKTPHSGRRRIHCGKRTSHPSGSRRNTALQRTTSLAGLCLSLLSLCFSWMSFFNLFLIGAVIFFCLVIPGGPPACPKGIDCVNLLILATALLATAAFTVWYLHSSPPV